MQHRIDATPTFTEAPVFRAVPPAPPPADPPAPRLARRWPRAAVLFLIILASAVGMAVWKRSALASADRAFASQPEPAEAVTVAVAAERTHRPTTTAIGTVRALRSITLRNELPGTVRSVALVPGSVVEAGKVLVAFDVSVEQAELSARQAQAALAESTLERFRRASATRAVSEVEVDRARAERDVAIAEIARIRALIARKTIRAPFRARVGIADVHPGQYLEGGTELTTLQGVDDAAHVEFSVAQRVASELAPGGPVTIQVPGSTEPLTATIVAVDARVDPTTRNALVRARLSSATVSPGASVRVEVPVGPERPAVVVPVSALRKGPEGDHVFVIAPDAAGVDRAAVRPVESGAVLGDDVLILRGLSAGERVASAGSFKLRESARVAVTSIVAAAPGSGRAPGNAATH